MLHFYLLPKFRKLSGYQVRLLFPLPVKNLVRTGWSGKNLYLEKQPSVNERNSASLHLTHEELREYLLLRNYLQLVLYQ